MKNPTSDGKRKRGAQPGNVNAVRYPWRVLFNRGVLKDEYSFLKPWMDDYINGLIADKGGSDNMSFAENCIANIAERAYGCGLMILIAAGREGLVRNTKEGWDLQPGFKEQSKYMQIELKALQAYGLKRVPREITMEQMIQDALKEQEKDNGTVHADGIGTEG